MQEDTTQGGHKDPCWQPSVLIGYEAPAWDRWTLRGARERSLQLRRLRREKNSHEQTRWVVRFHQAELACDHPRRPEQWECLEQRQEPVLNQGTLYPALVRLEQYGWVG